MSIIILVSLELFCFLLACVINCCACLAYTLLENRGVRCNFIDIAVYSSALLLVLSYNYVFNIFKSLV